MYNIIKASKFLSVTAAFFLILNACSADQPDNPGTEASAQSETGLKQAPDFEVTTIDGEVMSLEKSMDNDKPLVVYFTASWCPTCARNWPALSEVYPEYEDKLDLVAIGIDPTDDEEVMRNLAEKEGFTFPSTKGYPNVMVDFGARSQATTVGVNRDGYIVFMKSNQALSSDEYRELFDELVK